MEDLNKNPKDPGVIGAYCSKEMENAFTYYAQARNLSKSRLAGLLLFPALVRLLNGDAELPPGQWIEALKEQALAVLKRFRFMSEKHRSANLSETFELSSYVSISTPNENARGGNVPSLNFDAPTKEAKGKIKKLRTTQKEIMERGARKNSNSKTGSKTGHAGSVG